MSILKQISQLWRQRPGVLSTSSGDGASASGHARSEPDASIEVDMALVKVRIEPDSVETKAQSLLKARSIEDPIFTIGRRRGLVSQSPEDVDFSIRQVEPYTVSRRHCSIERLADSVIVSDLGGKYGSLVNGQRIGGRDTAPKSINLIQGRHDLVLGPRDSTIRFKLIVD